MEDWEDWNKKARKLKDLKKKIEIIENEIERLIKENTIKKIAIKPEKWMKFNELPDDVGFVEIREWVENDTKEEKPLWTIKAWAMVPKDVADKINKLEIELKTLTNEADELRRWLIIHRPIE